MFPMTEGTPYRTLAVRHASANPASPIEIEKKLGGTDNRRRTLPTVMPPAVTLLGLSRVAIVRSNPPICISGRAPATISCPAWARDQPPGSTCTIATTREANVRHGRAGVRKGRQPAFLTYVAPLLRLPYA